MAAPTRVPSIPTLNLLPVHNSHVIFFFYIDSNTFQLKLHKISETLTSASLRGCQIQLFDFNSNCMNFHLGIFNSAYMYYHNKVKAVQFFPKANSTDMKEKKRIKWGREGWRKGGRQAVRASCQTEIVPPKGPLPSLPTGHEWMWGSLTHTFKRRYQITFLDLPLTHPTGEALWMWHAFFPSWPKVWIKEGYIS